ncbi:MAG: hypothetical protein M1818_003514 [Claussenomyces sp. TS43310]|nr:MAG: hypothetical protein M1818_003514 [Claussenomyces sp. TS43310]
MEDGLVETGYTINPLQRLEQHYQHRASNYIICLAEAISSVLFSDQNFFLKGFVVLPLIDWPSITIGEILISRIGQSHLKHGSGFSRQGTPGWVMDAACTKITVEEWNTFQTSLWERDDYRERIDRETRKTKASVKARKERKRSQAEAQIAALEPHLTALIQEDAEATIALRQAEERVLRMGEKNKHLLRLLAERLGAWLAE